LSHSDAGKRYLRAPNFLNCLWIHIRLLLLGLTTLAVQPLHSDVSVQWNTNALDAQGKDSASTLAPVLADYLEQSNVVSDFTGMLNEAFDIPSLQMIEIGSQSGPLYDAQAKVIRLPFSYLEQAIRSQMQLVDDDQETLAVDRAIDVVEYTLYHLLGHAILAEASVDVDEMAEALSTWIMLNYWPNGAEQWFADVQAFSDASMKLDGPLEDFWHSHSVYKSRRDTLRCWILGYDPERAIGLMPATLDPEQRNIRCAQSYQELDRLAREKLSQQLSENSPLRN